MGVAMTEDLIPTGHKFACIVLAGAKPINLPHPVQIDHDILVSMEPPLRLPGHWGRWVGQAEASFLDEPHLVLVASEASDEPTHIDERNRALEQKLHRFHVCLGIEAMAETTALITFGGGQAEENPVVREFGKLLPHVHLRSVAPEPIDQEVLRRASQLRAGADFIFDTPISLPASPRARLHLGLHALDAGLREARLPERIHQLCRAIEATIAPRDDRIVSDFRRRGRTFAKGADVDTALAEIHGLHHTFEHLHQACPESFADLDDATKQRRAERRTYEAELIARHVYRRLLGDVAFIKQVFADEATLSGFWRQNARHRTKAWGKPLDLDAVMGRTNSFAEIHSEY